MSLPSDQADRQSNSSIRPVRSLGPPVVRHLEAPPSPVDALSRFADLPGLLLLHSSEPRPRLGRYSYLTAAPRFTFERRHVAYGDRPFAEIESLTRRWKSETVPGLPPFQGGIAGLLSYELAASWERLTPPRFNEFPVPLISLGVYDWVIAWDHDVDRAWILCQSLEDAMLAPGLAAEDRIADCLRRLSSAEPAVPCADFGRRAAGNELARQYALPGHQRVTSSFSRPEYLRSIQRVIEYIAAGDIFQANLTQRLLAPQTSDPLTLYRILCEQNPAPFAAYYAGDDWTILSASPEQFLSVNHRKVETRPIKGTRARSADACADTALARQLAESEKDRAENVMIVDLLRNDLARVCEPWSVEVPELCTVESYKTVHHLVSSVTGELRPRKSVWDLFAAAFPGGSITGAPKVRSMEILRELEPTARRAYCGCLLFNGFDGSANSSILIRTITCSRGWLQYPVGGGITVASEPAEEYEETLIKAEGFFRLLSSLPS